MAWKISLQKTAIVKMVKESIMKQTILFVILLVLTTIIGSNEIINTGHVNIMTLAYLVLSIIGISSKEYDE